MCMQNLLLDANLSWRSVKVLEKYFDKCFHVDNVGLKMPAKDSEIWDFAKSENLVIVSNDEDFLNFSSLKGFPPKVILLKTGNQSRKFIEEIIINKKQEIENFIKNSEFGLLEIM